MAGVKSMLNKFEQTDNMSAGRGNKPSVAAKPVLQRFQQAAKENDSTTPAFSSLTSNPVLQAGHPSVVKLAGLTGGIPALKPVTANKPGDNAGDKGRRPSAPKVFQNGQKTQDASNDNNNNNDQTAAKKDSWPPATSPSNDNKPTIVPKFPTMSVSNMQKPTFPSTKPDNDKNLENSKPKTALLPKNAHKTDSIRSNSSNSSSSSASSASSSSSYQTASVSSPISSTPKSPPSSSSQSPASGVFDFKSMLRKVDTSSSGPPVKRVLSGISNDSSSSETPTSKAPVSPSSSTASTTSSTNIEKPKTPSRVPPIPSTDSIEMRNKPNQAIDDIVIRKSDGKRFRRMPPPSHKPSTAPKKPAVPSNIDLTSIRQQYQKLKNGSDIVPQEEEEEEDDIYWEGETLNNPATPPPPPVKPVTPKDRASQRISLIPEMSAEEEEGDQPIYDDTPIEDDVYDDAMSESLNERKPKTSISSESQETEQDRKKRLKEEANAKKKEEKERREKEKKERDEEKKRKKKEEEELRLRSKFSLTGQEKMVGEGVIKQDAKASGLNLRVKKGQIVTIVRLDSNPPNKWLVKLDTQLGYVDSQNIEVDPNIIRQVMLRYFLDSNCSLEKSLALLAARQTPLIAMTGQTEEDDFDQPTYDDVPEENGPSFIVPLHEDDEEEDLEEIYEMCE